VSIRFIAEGMVIAGDNSGRLVLVTIEMAKNPEYIEYSAPYKGESYHDLPRSTHTWFGSGTRIQVLVRASLQFSFICNPEQI